MHLIFLQVGWWWAEMDDSSLIHQQQQKKNFSMQYYQHLGKSEDNLSFSFGYSF
jgi:hypothetical protein